MHFRTVFYRLLYREVITNKINGRASMAGWGRILRLF